MSEPVFTKKELQRLRQYAQHEKMTPLKDAEGNEYWEVWIDGLAYRAPVKKEKDDE